MKRMLGLLMTLLMILSVAVGCGGQQTPENAGGGNSTVPEQKTETVDYPKSTINFIVPFSAGGGTDTMARAVTSVLDMGVSTVVTNIEGASAGTGSMEVYHSAPDGYTLLTHSPEGIVTNCKTGTYSAPLDRELRPVAAVAHDPMLVSVAANGKFSSLQDVVDYAREHPGELKWASTGTATNNFMTSALIWAKAGIEVTYVPFDGASKSKAAVLGGNADILLGQVSEAKSLVEGGELIPLCVCSEERSSVDSFTEVPTAKELGYDVVMADTRGFFAPPGTPDAVIAILSAKIEEVCNDADFQSKMTELGYECGFYNSEDMSKIIEETRPMIEEAMKSVGM